MDAKAIGPIAIVGVAGVFALMFSFFGLLTAAGFASFGNQPGGNQAASGSSVSCGSIETVDQIDGITIPYPNTKLGHEEHLTETRPKHYAGPDSNPLTFAGPGAYAPHTTDQERWYFNEYWPLAKNYDYAKYAHKKVLIESVETGKCVVGSIEEAGPAPWVTARDGIGAGAPPEVRNALGHKRSPYDGNPNSDVGRIRVKFVKDQKNTPLGPTQ